MEGSAVGSYLVKDSVLVPCPNRTGVLRFLSLPVGRWYWELGKSHLQSGCNDLLLLQIVVLSCSTELVRERDRNPERQLCSWLFGLHSRSWLEDIPKALYLVASCLVATSYHCRRSNRPRLADIRWYRVWQIRWCLNGLIYGRIWHDYITGSNYRI